MKLLNTFITYGLSILFLTVTVHHHVHTHEHVDGYNMCDIDCDDSHHTSNSHECEKCVNNNTRVLNQVFNDNIPFQVTPFLDYTDECFKSNYLCFSLFSRPPPIASLI